MQAISHKLSRVMSAAPADWSRDDVRHLIHGVGGSPRRARRLLKADDGLAQALELRDAYIADIGNGVPHTNAVANANGRWQERFVTESDAADAQDGDDDTDE